MQSLYYLLLHSLEMLWLKCINTLAFLFCINRCVSKGSFFKALTAFTAVVPNTHVAFIILSFVLVLSSDTLADPLSIAATLRFIILFSSLHP